MVSKGKELDWKVRLTLYRKSFSIFDKFSEGEKQLVLFS